MLLFYFYGNRLCMLKLKGSALIQYNKLKKTLPDTDEDVINDIKYMATKCYE